MSRRPRPDVGAWRVVPLDEGHVEQVLSWHHDPPDDFYDADLFPEDVDQLRDPAFRAEHKAAVVDPDDVLVGQAEWHATGDVVTIGLGLRPDLIGLGLGASFVELLLAHARERFAPVRFRLEVADWNVRAITVYERCGFVDTGARRTATFERFGDVVFVEMVRTAEP